MSLIADTLLSYLPPKRKHTPSGWISFNAPCCVHNGTGADTRQRGGFIVNGGDAVSYHCFNCGFKASWQPGRTLSPKLKKLMQWFNVPDDIITKLTFDALRLKEDADAGTQQKLVPTFTPRALPLDSKPLEECTNNKHIVPVLEYLQSRQVFLDDYSFYWTHKAGFKNRVIIPFYYHNQVVGWTARSVNGHNPKYISEQQPGYVFNLDKQHWDRKFVIVVEGPFDAIAVDGVALLGSEVKEGQHLLINQLQREVIVVPDRDSAGKKLVEQAIEFGWTVSMPEWPEGVKDVSDAVKILGKPAVLWLIITQRLQTELKIKLRMKQYFNE